MNTHLVSHYLHHLTAPSSLWTATTRVVPLLIFTVMFQHRYVITKLGKDLETHNRRHNNHLSVNEFAKSKHSRASFANLALENHWLVGKFEKYSPERWYAGICYLAVRLIQTSFMAMVRNQLVQAGIVCSVSLLVCVCAWHDARCGSASVMRSAISGMRRATRVFSIKACVRQPRCVACANVGLHLGANTSTFDVVTLRHDNLKVLCCQRPTRCSSFSFGSLDCSRGCSLPRSWGRYSVSHPSLCFVSLWFLPTETASTNNALHNDAFRQRRRCLPH